MSKIDVLKKILGVLDNIDELRELSPEKTNGFDTYCGRLSSRHLVYSDFQSILKKIEMRGIAKFDEGGGSGAMGWGSRSMTISIRSWKEFDKYHEEVKRTIDGL